jgi:hypothetical protein
VTEAEVIEALAQHWRDTWPALSVVPFTFDNEIADSAEQYARVSFVPTVRSQATMGTEGARRFHMRGQIFVQLFGPVNVGVKSLYELADKAREVFEATRIADEITTYAGSTRQSPSDGVWSMVTVTIPYLAEELR